MNDAKRFKPIRSRGSGALESYLLEIRGYPVLEFDDEVEIGRCIDGRMNEAVIRLVTSNLRSVVKIALGFRNRGLPLEDLISEGNIGLITAAMRYDPSRGHRFITYAVWWVRKSILSAIERHASTIRIPCYQLKKRARQRREEDSSLPAYPLRRRSLHDPLTPSTPFSLEETLMDDGARDPLEEVFYREGLRMLKSAWSCLESREQQIIIRRYGLGGHRVHALSEIGRSLGLSRERVRQLQTSALRKLRDRIEGRRTIQPPTRKPLRKKRTAPLRRR